MIHHKIGQKIFHLAPLLYYVMLKFPFMIFLTLQVIWDGNRAVGVEYVQWDNAKLNGTVYARGEVVLSGGAINTPLLLTHSGVGPREVLQKLKV